MLVLRGTSLQQALIFSSSFFLFIMDLWLIHLSEPKIDQLDEAVYAYIYILLLVTVMESHSSVSQSVCLSSFICLSVCLSVYLHARGSAGQSFTSVAPATKSLSAELWEVREGCVVEVVATKKISLLLGSVRKLRYSRFFCFFPQQQNVHLQLRSARRLHC